MFITGSFRILEAANPKNTNATLLPKRRVEISRLGCLYIEYNHGLELPFFSNSIFNLEELTKAISKPLKVAENRMLHIMIA
jgi:hypothetical protein